MSLPKAAWPRLLLRLSPLALLLLSMTQTGCSIRTLALRGAADALSGTGGGFGTEDDPAMVRDAAPFGLKTMESLAQALPDHRPLRLSMASGFAQYAYAFVNQDSDRLEDTNVAQGRELAARARRLYLRARDYALDGLNIGHAGAKAALLGGDQAAWKSTLATMQVEDVPFLYWTGASWALAVSTAKDDPKLIGDLGVIGLIMTRALELDESYDEGAIHEFFVTFDAARGEMQGGGPAKSKEHLDKAQAQCKGTKLGALISYAEGVLVQKQQKAEFVALLKKVLDANVHVDDPNWRKNRLANLIAQARARWLMSKLSDLFAE